MHMRAPIEVRPADIEDAGELIALWEAVLCDSADGLDIWRQFGRQDPPSVAEAANVLEFNRDHHGRLVLIALIEGELVGAAAADVTTVSMLMGPKVLVVSDLQVHPEHRRRSVASSLLRAMAAHAEARECHLVVASLPSTAKEPNRFLAKIGFSQMAVLRGISLPRLHARLATQSSGSRETGRLVAMRRSLRRRSQTLTER